MTLLILALAGALATADTSPAATTTLTGVSAATKAADDSNKIVCRNDEITGSRFTQRICRTKAQWAKDEQIAATYKREVEDRDGLQGKQSGPFGN